MQRPAHGWPTEVFAPHLPLLHDRSSTCLARQVGLIRGSLSLGPHPLAGHCQLSGVASVSTLLAVSFVPCGHLEIGSGSCPVGPMRYEHEPKVLLGWPAEPQGMRQTWRAFACCLWTGCRRAVSSYPSSSLLPRSSPFQRYRPLSQQAHAQAMAASMGNCTYLLGVHNIDSASNHPFHEFTGKRAIQDVCSILKVLQTAGHRVVLQPKGKVSACRTGQQHISCV